MKYSWQPITRDLDYLFETFYKVRIRRVWIFTLSGFKILVFIYILN